MLASKVYQLLCIWWSCFISACIEITSSGTFEADTEVNFTCHHTQYTGIQIWTVNTAEILICDYSTCKQHIWNPTRFSFRNNMSTGVFVFTVSPIKRSDDGTTVACYDGNNETTLTIKVEGARLDRQEQYSRRNCLRISGITETSEESTDNIVLGISQEIKSNITISEIDRSHRVGMKKANKPRDIIVKFVSYRARQKLYLNRSSLKNSKYSGAFVNEDLTHRRSFLLYKARQLVTSRHLYGAWSSDGVIIVKDNKHKVHRISTEHEIESFLLYPPRPLDDEEPNIN